MKRFFIAAAIAAAALSTPASAQVSVNIGQPGFYGRIDIGGFPPPPLLYPAPRMIHRVPVSRPPLTVSGMCTASIVTTMTTGVTTVTTAATTIVTMTTVAAAVTTMVTVAAVTGMTEA